MGITQSTPAQDSLSWSDKCAVLQGQPRLSSTRWRLSPREQTALNHARSDGGLVVEWSVMRSLQEQGFDLDPDRDNKSVGSADELIDRLAKYGERAELNYDKAVLTDALRLAWREFGRGNSEALRALPLDERLADEIKQSKSSGLPELSRKAEAFVRDLDRARAVQNGHAAPQPCFPFRRVQHGDSGPKTRLVWGYPQSMTLLEATFARPLIRRFLSRETPMAFGLRKFELAARLTRIENSGVRVGVDISAFDARVPSFLVEEAFKILSSHFDMDESETERWEAVLAYFVHTPILFLDGRVYRKHQGVPSGSFFTQLVDSIVNYMLVQYAVLRLLGKPVEAGKLLVLGDDSVFGLDQYVRVERLARYFRELNARVSAQKSSVTRAGEPLPFLGHVWQRGLANRPPGETAIRMAFPERHSNEQGRLRVPTRVWAYLGDSVDSWPMIRALSGYRGSVIPQAVFVETLDWAVTGLEQAWESTLAPHDMFGKRHNSLEAYVTLFK